MLSKHSFQGYGRNSADVCITNGASEAVKGGSRVNAYRDVFLDFDSAIIVKGNDRFHISVPIIILFKIDNLRLTGIARASSSSKFTLVERAFPT